MGLVGLVLVLLITSAIRSYLFFSTLCFGYNLLIIIKVVKILYRTFDLLVLDWDSLISGFWRYCSWWWQWFWQSRWYWHTRYIEILSLSSLPPFSYRENQWTFCYKSYAKSIVNEVINGSNHCLHIIFFSYSVMPNFEIRFAVLELVSRALTIISKKGRR